MATYKKKSFSKKIKEEELDELIDADGALISNDTSKFTSDSEVSTDTPFGAGYKKRTGGPLDTDTHVDNTRQKRKYPWGYGYATSATSMRESKRVLAKEKMENMIDELMNGRSDTNDFVKNNNSQDINRNTIPDIDDVTNNNQALSSSLKSVIEIIGKQEVSGDGVGIILNHIISNIDVSKIPADYIRIIKGKI